MADILVKETKARSALVDRRGGVQLWRQIADCIRQAICAGDFGALELLPSESSLAERFSVNRHTVRAALAVLAREGIVQPVQGKGTLILRRDRLIYPIARRTRFSRGLAGQVDTLSFEIRSSGRVRAGQELVDALKVEPGTECITLETLGSADGLPLSLASHVFLPRLKALPEIFAHTGSITRALEALAIDDYVRLSTHVIARFATAEEVFVLALMPSAIILETVAVNGLPDGTPFQFSCTRFAADRIKLSLHTKA